MTEARQGFFPIVTGEEVRVSQGGGVAFVARRDLAVTMGGGQVLAAGNDLTVDRGGGWFLGCGNRLTVTHGGAAVAAGRRVDLRHSRVGVVLGVDVSLGDGARVLAGPREAALFGVAAGLVCALAGRLLRRR